MLDEMKERVTVESRSITTSGGEQSETFTDNGTFWAKAVPVRAQERGQDLDSFSEVVRFHFRRCATIAAIDDGYRLVWNSDYYDVIQRPHLADRQYVAVVAERRKPNARD